VSPVAIVTASDSGIGQETAKELAENGFDIGITYHEDETGAGETLAAVEGAGRWGEVRQLDLTNLPKAADVIDDLADALGGVDVLVNNAGTPTLQASSWSFPMTSGEEFWTLIFQEPFFAPRRLRAKCWKWAMGAG
jgi:NAD(P)-dependent dehydrogenase (short-subunit alcohol dehydrogenase family)